MPAISRRVGPAVRAFSRPEGMGFAWARAIRQARNRIVRGDGEGIGEDEAPRRWIMGDFLEELEEAFSFASRSCCCCWNVGARKMILGRVSDLVVSSPGILSDPVPCSSISGIGIPSIVARSILLLPPLLPSPLYPPPEESRSLLIRKTGCPCLNLSYQIHCNTKHTSTNT